MNLSGLVGWNVQPKSSGVVQFAWYRPGLFGYFRWYPATSSEV